MYFPIKPWRMSWQAERKHAPDILEVLQGRIPTASLRVVILAAHSDDETIGASALLAKFPQSRVVYLTDGAPRNQQLWSPDASGSREGYAAMRRSEAEASLAHAGISAQQITWLGGVDQEAILASAALTRAFAEYLRTNRADVIVTHPYEGGHPDHDTAALVARAAIAVSAADAVLLEMTSYHAGSGGCVSGKFLDSDPSCEIRFELSAEQSNRKRQMLDAHASQRAVLASFRVDDERLRLAPEYDFSKPPHQGQLWYESMHWQLSGAQWRVLAGNAIREMQECNAAHSA